MKTINISVPMISIDRKTISLPKISLPKISFWKPFTNLLNRVTEEKFTVADTKKIAAGCSMLLLLVNIHVWPLAIFPTIYLIMKGNKK